MLGNLVKVEEPNPAYGQSESVSTNFVTNYTYDVEGHLVSVAMPRPYGGGTQTQTRSFSYNLATGKLMSATNPENGTVSYAYYADGVLQSKTDAKGQKVVYSYDGYGRVSYIDRYPNGTTWDACQSVALSYDATANSANGLGRLSSATTGTGCAGTNSLTEYYAYTAGGLVTTKGYGVNFPTYWASSSIEYIGYSEGPTASFTYDTEGHQTGYNNFVYSLDAMGRPTSLTEIGPGTIWVQNAAYGPGGEMQTMQYRSSSGIYFTENRTYNNRAQLKELISNRGVKPAIDLQYVYTAGANNGQISQMNDLLSGEQTVYNYDSLKRLTQAQASVSLWGQSFGYDGWGNLVSKTPTAGHTGTAMSLSVDGATNHVTSGGFAYDANGNATTIPATPNISLTYDVENRTGGTRYDQQNQPLDRGGVCNLYGLRGERLGTFSYSAGYSWTNVVVDQYGDTVSIGTPTVTQTQLTRNIYFGGRLIQSNGVTVATDRLGSARADENGNQAEFYPYGEKVSSGLTTPDLFGTYSRDSGTGLDYANQRWYSSTYGRFTIVDPAADSADTNDPGSWNRYSYVVGDPANRFDPSGLHYYCDPDTDPSCIDPAVNNCLWNPYDASCGWPGGGGNGFFPVLGAAGVGGIGGIGAVIGEGGAISACVLSGVCVAAVSGSVAVTAIAITIANSHPFSPVPIITINRKGKTDPIEFPTTGTPWRDASGSCMRPPQYKWQDSGNDHGGRFGFHWHWITWNLRDRVTCTYFPRREDGPNDPGPEYILLQGTYAGPSATPVGGAPLPSWPPSLPKR